MKPQLIKLTGSALSQERYTYGQHLQYNGVYAYGGPGSLVNINPEEKIAISLRRNLTASDMRALIAYDDVNTTYNDSTRRYNGADSRQDDGPQLEVIL